MHESLSAGRLQGVVELAANAIERYWPCYAGYQQALLAESWNETYSVLMSQNHHLNVTLVGERQMFAISR